MSIRVAVDALGGDNAPTAVIEGCVRAVEQAEGRVQVLLAGPEAKLKPALDEALAGRDLPISVVNATQHIEMAESPATAAKGKPDSSIHVGVGLHKKGLADAFVSAGNTGACMAVSLFGLGRLPGVARPAVIGYYPTVQGFCIMLDVGTNVDCRPEHLVQFALMGGIYAEHILKRESPTVALMNVGEERGKGNEQAKATYELLSQVEGLNFVGNIEGRDLMEHAADVVVTDGFIGNIVLKLGESVATVLPKLIAKEMAAQRMGPEEQAIVGRAFKGVLGRFDYEEYGGVPLLGVAGNVVLGHGGSGARAFENMVRVAADIAAKDVTGRISAALSAAG